MRVKQKERKERGVKITQKRSGGMQEQMASSQLVLN